MTNDERANERAEAGVADDAGRGRAARFARWIRRRAREVAASTLRVFDAYAPSAIEALGIIGAFDVALSVAMLVVGRDASSIVTLIAKLVVLVIMVPPVWRCVAVRRRQMVDLVDACSAAHVGERDRLLAERDALFIEVAGARVEVARARVALARRRSGGDA